MAAPQGVKTPWVNGLRKALINMKEGGKALVLMGPSWGYGGSSSYTQSYASLSYEVQLIRVIKDPIKYDAARIAKCLKALGKTANDSVKGANNIYLFNETAGINDTLATAGDTVYLKYTGRLLPNKETISTRADVLSGTRFDHADSAAFVVGGSTVAGFNSAIQKIKPKSAGFFIIPYDKAYGIEGNTNKNKVAVIPQYNAIIFEYKVIRIAKIKKS